VGLGLGYQPPEGNLYIGRSQCLHRFSLQPMIGDCAPMSCAMRTLNFRHMRLEVNAMCMHRVPATISIRPAYVTIGERIIIGTAQVRPPLHNDWKIRGNDQPHLTMTAYARARSLQPFLDAVICSCMTLQLLFPSGGSGNGPSPVRLHLSAPGLHQHAARGKCKVGHHLMQANSSRRVQLS
jgi:hypothetical protein